MKIKTLFRILPYDSLAVRHTNPCGIVAEFTVNDCLWVKKQSIILSSSGDPLHHEPTGSEYLT